MRCPYCVAEVADEAAVCSHCRRDLLLVKSLVLKIKQLESELASRDQVAMEAALQAAEAAEQQGGTDAAGKSPTPRGYLSTLMRWLLPVVVLLVAAQVLLLFVYDANPLYLRFASMLIPLPAGYIVAREQPRRMAWSTVAGFGMALVAVFIMLCITARIDGVPVLPQEMREVREVLEYAASIGFAFLTGLLLAMLKQRRRVGRPGSFVLFVARLCSKNEEGKLGRERIVKRVQQIVSVVAPAASAATSVYSGIKALMSG